MYVETHKHPSFSKNIADPYNNFHCANTYAVPVVYLNISRGNVHDVSGPSKTGTSLGSMSHTLSRSFSIKLLHFTTSHPQCATHQTPLSLTPRATSTTPRQQSVVKININISITMDLPPVQPCGNKLFLIRRTNHALIDKFTNKKYDEAIQTSNNGRITGRVRNIILVN